MTKWRVYATDAWSYDYWVLVCPINHFIDQYSSRVGGYLAL